MCGQSIRRPLHCRLSDDTVQNDDLILSDVENRLQYITEGLPCTRSGRDVDELLSLSGSEKASSTPINKVSITLYCCSPYHCHIGNVAGPYEKAPGRCSGDANTNRCELATANHVCFNYISHRRAKTATLSLCLN